MNPRQEMQAAFAAAFTQLQAIVPTVAEQGRYGTAVAVEASLSLAIAQLHLAQQLAVETGARLERTVAYVADQRCRTATEEEMRSRVLALAAGHREDEWVG